MHYTNSKALKISEPCVPKGVLRKDQKYGNAGRITIDPTIDQQPITKHIL